MTNFNCLSKFNNWLGELSSRMSLVGVSYEASGARVAREAIEAHRRVSGGQSRSKCAAQVRKANIELLKAEWLKYAAAIMLVLTLGVGNVWGTDITLEITVSSFGSGTTSSYGTLSWSEEASDGTTVSGSSVRIIKDASNMRFNSSYLYNTVAMPGAIKSIEVTKYSNTSRSVTPYIHTSSMSEGTTGATALTAHTHPYTWEMTAAQISADNRYFRLNFTTGSAYYVGKITITCAGEDCSNKLTLTKGGTTNGSISLNIPFIPYSPHNSLY